MYVYRHTEAHFYKVRPPVWCRPHFVVITKFLNDVSTEMDVLSEGDFVELEL